MGGQVGYADEERERLARTYLAIATLASLQGHIALVSTVSAFRFVEDSLRAQSSRNRIIRLDVSYEMLLKARPDLYEMGHSPVDASNLPMTPDLHLTADSPKERGAWISKTIQKLNVWL